MSWKRSYPGDRVDRFLQASEQGRLAADIIRRLQSQGYETYLVGGAVRDSLLGRSPREFDIASSAHPRQVAETFPEARWVGAQFGVMLVPLQGYNFDVATFRRDSHYIDGRHPQQVKFCSAQEDACRRDFTVNALYYDPVRKRVYDDVGGWDDLGNRILRTIGPARTRLEEDYLRIMRAVRFAAQLRFRIAPELRTEIEHLRDKIAGLSMERVQMEMNKLLLAPGKRFGLELMQQFGLMRVLLPEVNAMSGVPQSAKHHPEGDVWQHILKMFDHLVWPDPVLAWAVLLHDVGKPITYAQNEKGEPTFYQHEAIGSELARDILQRLRYSNEHTTRVSRLVRRHMQFTQLPHMRQSTLRRFMDSPDFGLELELHRIDCAASHARFHTYHYALDVLHRFANTPLVPPPLLRGRDIVAAGIPPGPVVGQLLQELQQLQLDGKISQEEEAREWLSRRLQTMNDNRGSGQ